MKVFNRSIKLGGHNRTINDISVRVLEYDHEGNVLRASGLTAPTGSGYAKGALFIKTDAASGTKALYENQGTTTSASFNLVGDVTVGEITLAEGSLLVGNSSGVGVALDASADAQILVGDGTTLASVAVSGDATLDNAGELKLALGTSGSPLAHTDKADKAYVVHTTQSDTDAGTSYEPVLFSTELTGAGQVGGRVRAYMKTNVALGGWANALKAEVDFQTNGAVTGLGSAFVAEMTMPGSAISTGNYAPLELELNLPASFASAGVGTPVSFIHMSAQGATIGEFDEHGYLMSIQGLTAGSGELFQTGNTFATPVATLKVLVGAVEYYLPLYDGQITTQ
jgi:hypothetical protein